MKSIYWREIFLAAGLAALTSHLPPEPARTAVMKCGLSGVTLLAGLCSPEKAYLLLTASRRPGCSEPQGWLSCCSDWWTHRELWLPASPLPGREWESTFCLQRCQTETFHLHLPHYRAKRLLCHSDDIIVLLSQLGWHQSEPLPDRKVCSCRMYFQQGTFNIISDIKDKKQEAGTEAEFKVMDERNVQIVCANCDPQESHFYSVLPHWTITGIWNYLFSGYWPAATSAVGHGIHIGCVSRCVTMGWVRNRLFRG